MEEDDRLGEDDYPIGAVCPECGAALRPCARGAPDMHCDTCGAVVPLYELEE